jgi:hypothetical protein
MVDIRVRVEDTTRVPELVQRLSKIFDRSSVAFYGATKEIRVAAEWESRTVISVIEAVQEWVGENGDSATLSIGGRSNVAEANR